MNKRINDKINEIKKYLSEIESIKPKNLEYYLSDIKTKAACERYFEKIIEAVIDLAFLLIKEHGFETPEEDTHAIYILASNKIISDSLSKKLKEAKGMRNILAHQYGSIDDEMVYDTITEELTEDIKEFIHSIKK
jgi:uncharacterized protein YutE (UPF0331/DUF86 family)